jgi:hypothetical protein
MIIPNEDFLSENKSEYREYEKLNDYQKKCLSATNYWRVMSGLKEIKVPAEDVDYYKYFNRSCFDKYNKKVKYAKFV